jgi:hypothetical protein
VIFLGLPFNACSLIFLRLLNLITVCSVLPSITSNLYRHLHPAASKEHLLVAGVLPAFPLLSFYGNLYYTDVVSTALVLASYLYALQNRHFVSGIVRLPKERTLTSQLGSFSVLTRQTNIIWVAFIMAVSIIRRLKEVDVIDQASTNQRSWLIFDPLAAEARFPGKSRANLGMAHCICSRLPRCKPPMSEKHDHRILRRTSNSNIVQLYFCWFHWLPAVE